MKLEPIDQASVQQTCQVLLALLSDADIRAPVNMSDGITSGKSLLRGIIQGQLLICAPAAPKAPVAEEDEDVDVDVDEEPVEETAPDDPS